MYMANLQLSGWLLAVHLVGEAGIPGKGRRLLASQTLPVLPLAQKRLEFDAAFELKKKKLTQGDELPAGVHGTVHSASAAGPLAL